MAKVAKWRAPDLDLGETVPKWNWRGWLMLIVLVAGGVVIDGALQGWL